MRSDVRKEKPLVRLQNNLSAPIINKTLKRPDKPVQASLESNNLAFFRTTQISPEKARIGKDDFLYWKKREAHKEEQEVSSLEFYDGGAGLKLAEKVDFVLRQQDR
jgi:hypothetical protein